MDQLMTIDRSVTENGDKSIPLPYLCAFMDLMLMSRHDGIDMDGFDKIERGKIVTSVKYLSIQWGWALGAVEWLLNRLEKDGFIKRGEIRGFELIAICRAETMQVIMGDD